MQKLLQVTAFVKRFIHSCKKVSQKMTGDLTLLETDQAHEMWLRHVQETEVKSDNHYNQWKGTMGLFEDRKGMVRCRGRFGEADMPYSMKYPLWMLKTVGSQLWK